MEKRVTPGNGILENKMQQNERVYREACAVFGGDPRVFRYYDQTDEVSVDLLTEEEVPLPGAVSYSTLGLIHYPIGQRAGDKPQRVELAAACYRKCEYFPNLLSCCAFDVMNARFSCRHGSVYPDAVNTYIQFSPMKHMLFVADGGFWQRPLPELAFGDKRVLWLTVLGISDSELVYLEKHGLEALLARLRQAAVKPWDWERESVLP